jgi:hypothetical protein
MAIIHDVFTVGTTATLICEIPEGNPTISVYIYNSDNNPIFIGDSTISVSGASQGLTIPKTTVYEFKINAEDKLYAISSAGTSANAVAVMYSKVVG